MEEVKHADYMHWKRVCRDTTRLWIRFWNKNFRRSSWFVS